MGVMSGMGRGVKWVFKPFFDFRVWSASNEIKRTASVIRSEALSLGKPQQAGKAEDFAAALQRLGVTEAELKQKQRNFLRIALVFLGLGFLGLLYCVYLLFNGYFMSGVLAFVVSLLTFAYAFRYHFWFFQIKHRKLGCSVKEWFNGKVGDIS